MNILKVTAGLLIALCLASCSVYKAASNEGISVNDIKKCQTKACFIGHGMEIVDKHVRDDGKSVEIYRAIARKSGANYLRAAGHGVLDVATLGLWEVAGTPVEGAISNNRGYITVQAIFSEPDVIESFIIYDANGKEALKSAREVALTPK
jgi:hypothetical protein